MLIPLRRSIPIQVSLLYGLAAGFWVLSSDRMLAGLLPNVQQLTLLQNLKGAGFVIATTVVLYLLLMRYQHSLDLVIEEQHRRARIYQTLFEQNHAVMLLIDPESGQIKDANRAACTFYGYSHPKLCSMKITDINTLAPEEVRDEMMQARRGGRNFFRFRHRLAGGQERDVEVYSAPINLDGEIVLHSMIHDVSELARHELQLSAVIEAVPDAIICADEQQRITLFNSAAGRLFGYDVAAVIGKPLTHFVPSHFRSKHAEAVDQVIRNPNIVGQMPTLQVVPALHADGHEFPVEISLAGVVSGPRRMAAAVLRDVSGRIRQEREREGLLMMVAALRQALTREELVDTLLDQIGTLLNGHSAALVQLDATNTAWVERGSGAWAALSGTALSSRQSISHRVMADGQARLIADIHNEPNFYRPDLLASGTSAICVPLVAHQSTVGVLWVARGVPFSNDDLRLLTAVGDMAANALHRIMLHDQATRQLRQLEALIEIDRTIAVSHEAAPTLNSVIRALLHTLEVDGAAILLQETPRNRLQLIAAHGISDTFGRELQQRAADEAESMDECPSCMVFNQQDLLSIFILSKELSAQAGFSKGYFVPLVADDRPIGILHIFLRQERKPDNAWYQFLAAVAGQIAVALDRAELYSSLQRSNAELEQAYDETLAGWAHALELRDKETEGHSRRVTELSVQLAHKLGFDQEAIRHIRRGALLHDIGKLGVPDAILHKPGLLTPEERAVIELHPIYAYEWLKPIRYLHPALAIPYSHHEKWDGSGYPQGLRGEQIPLEARLFAVIDVWDAITSDRPYHTAWPAEHARNYIREQAGRHFDPQVVEAFLPLIT